MSQPEQAPAFRRGEHVTCPRWTDLRARFVQVIVMLVAVFLEPATHMALGLMPAQGSHINPPAARLRS
jgi:hypothetical protein